MSLQVSSDFKETLSRSQQLGLPFTLMYGDRIQGTPDHYLVACFKEASQGTLKPTTFTANTISPNDYHKIDLQWLEDTETTYTLSEKESPVTALDILHYATSTRLQELSRHAQQLCGPCLACAHRAQALAWLIFYFQENSCKEGFVTLTQTCLQNQLNKWPKSRPVSRVSSATFDTPPSQATSTLSRSNEEPCSARKRLFSSLPSSPTPEDL